MRAVREAHGAREDGLFCGVSGFEYDDGGVAGWNWFVLFTRQMSASEVQLSKFLLRRDSGSLELAGLHAKLTFRCLNISTSPQRPMTFRISLLSARFRGRGKILRCTDRAATARAAAGADIEAMTAMARV